MINMTKKSIVEKIGISIIAQIISLFISFILNLIVPKYISTYSYSYWQTYLLYVSYVGLLQFGLLDGILLRYSQYDYYQLDKSILRSQYKILLGLNVLSALVFIIIAIILKQPVGSTILVLVGIGVITKNGFYYTLYIFQMTNRIKNYAILTIMQRLAYGVTAIILLIFRIDNFVWFCIADLIGDCVGIGVGIVTNKDLYLGKFSEYNKTIQDLKINISAGIKLMIANWSATMIVGFAKTIIQWSWSVEIFGKISFSFSLTNLFLSFVTATAIVLFPTLKRMDESNLPQFYTEVRALVSPFLLAIMMLYFPGCWILTKWLPKYTDSLVYLGLLLPMILFSSRITLLTDNYMKAYRKEKKLLFINIFSIIIALIGFTFFALYQNSVDGLIVWVVISIMIRSIMSEYIVCQLIRKKFVKETVFEMLLAVIFMICARFFSLTDGLILYSISLGIFVIIYKKVLGVK